jgi:hypothetical protein
MTGFSKQCEILSQLWMDYRDEEDFEDFITYNDLGLPLAHFIHEEIVKSTPQAEMYIGETFNLFIAALEADPNEAYESLDDLLVRYGK